MNIGFMVPDPNVESDAYHVIKIDMNSEYQNTFAKNKMIRNLTKDVIEEMKRVFPDVKFGDLAQHLYIGDLHHGAKQSQHHTDGEGDHRQGYGDLKARQ